MGCSVWLTGITWYSNSLPRVFPYYLGKLYSHSRDRHSKFSRHSFWARKERKCKKIGKTNSEFSSVRNFLSEVNNLKVKVYFWSGCKYCQNCCEYTEYWIGVFSFLLGRFSFKIILVVAVEKQQQLKFIYEKYFTQLKK